VADALSRLHHLSPENIINYVFSHFSSQVHPTFHLENLPQEISSWMISWLQRTKEQKELEQVQKAKKGRVWKRWCKYYSIIKNEHDVYLQELFPKSKPDYLAPLLPLYEEGKFLSQMENLWEQAQLKRPWKN
jgi:hypothetical protein